MKGLSNSSELRNRPLMAIQVNQGLWPIITVCMTMQALKQPDVEVSILGLTQVRSQWYPAAFALALSMLRGSMQWDMLASIAAGHLWAQLDLDAWLLPRLRTMWRLERSWPSCWANPLSALLGGRWIPPADGSGGTGRRGGDWGEIGNQGRPLRGGGEQPGFQLFGGPGRRLGD